MPLVPIGTIPTDGPAVVVDADGLIYKALAATQTIWDGEPLADLPRAHEKFDDELTSWCRHFPDHRRYLALTSKGRTHRVLLYSDYKGNRTEDSRPALFHEFRKEVEDRHDCVVVRGLEADDVLGLLGSRRADQGWAVVSPDKDMATLPGCTWFQPGVGVHANTEDEANLNWLRQSLTGDMVDNFPGIPKVGPKTAEKILPKEAPLEVLWEVYCRAYEAKGFDETYATTMARLARILRPEDYEVSTQKVLWEDPGRRGDDQRVADYGLWVPGAKRASKPSADRGPQRPRDTHGRSGTISSGVE